VTDLLPRWAARTVAACLAFLVLALTAWVVVDALGRVRMVTVSLVAALLLAALLTRLHHLLLRSGLPGWSSALLSVLGLVGVVTATVTLVVSRALNQVSDLQKALTRGTQDLEKLLVNSPLPLSRQQVDRAEKAVAEFVTGALPSPSAGATMAVEIVSGAALALFVLFFLLLDGRRMWAWAVSWIPQQRHEQVDGAGRRAWAVLTGYVRSIVLVAFIDAIGIGVVMLVLGVPLAASLTLIVFVGAFVPIVGAAVSGVLAVGVTLVTVGPVPALVLLAAVLLVQQLEGNVLQPWIMGRTLKLHPVVVVLAVTLGSVVGGVLGAVVAVPLVAVCYRVVEFLAGRSEDEQTVSSPGKDGDTDTDPADADAGQPQPAAH
jgi:predicted PurR-regulated permease PerM